MPSTFSGDGTGRTKGAGQTKANSKSTGYALSQAPANSRTIKSSAKIGTVTREAVRSAVLAISKART